MPITNTEPIDPKVYREMGLNDEEYAKITEVLGRHPTYTEVGMYAVMWSEHCGYKYSRPILRYFKKYKEAIDGAGLENAGVIDIGGGYGVVFKIESHNHPSAVEPFQGAATGVGGILRDIFTMGARPIANLNSLRFGSLDNARTKYLFEHVVGGIAFYGNCVGVPTVGGEVYFEDCYAGNPLLNAMALGIMKHEDIAYARAEGVGNPVLVVGSRTGRDGIHGATFASVELTEESESRKSNVQMGDPFTEKLLIEATLEALKTGHITGIQDMGAAGITCSTCETSAKAGTGMKIDVRKVPLRETGMTPYEIMLSESQERMLAIVKKGREDEVAAVFKKWGLQAVVVGEVTDDGLVHVYDGDELVAEIPAKSLADEAPTYYLQTSEPAYLNGVQNYDLSRIPEPEDYNEALMKLMTSLLDSEQGVGIRAIRSHGPDEHDRAARLGCRRSANQRDQQGNRGHDGLQRPVLLSGPVRGRADSRRGGREEPGLHGREADRRDRLPQLRQPRKTRGVLAVRAVREGAGGGVRFLRRAGRQRQREFLQRDPGDVDLPHPDYRDAGADR